MKKTLSILAIAILLLSCNNTVKSSENSSKNEKVSDTTKTTAQKIALANGFENWKDVSEIQFTFNVDRGDTHFERVWAWQPKTNNVALFSEKDTLRYNRSKMDSLALKTDAAFINDKYWLLAPFQLVWNQEITFSEKENVAAPISKDSLNQLTIVYPNLGGYTPGDAYDFFYDANFKIKEWSYRKGNAKTPTMSTTWEDYENFNGIEIAKMHKDSADSFKVYFTDISVEKESGK